MGLLQRKQWRYFLMKKIKRIALCLTICAGLALPSIAHADIVLEYMVKGINVSAATTQDIAIKNDQIMVKAVGGDKNLDLLYRHAAENVVIVDHRKGTLMTVDEQQVDRINQQTQNVQTLLQGLGEQIAKLSPDQRQKLQELLGDNVSLDTIAKAAEPPAPTRLVPAGVKRGGGHPLPGDAGHAGGKARGRSLSGRCRHHESFGQRRRHHSRAFWFL